MSKYHFIGIGGIGMSALARILLQKGSKVQGSDLAASYVTEGLKQAGAQVFIEHSASLVSEPMTVIYSSDIRKENPEYQSAEAQKFPLIHRSDLLKTLMEGYKPLLVSGTHGKTTTSALLAHLLMSAGLDPSYAIGGTLVNVQANGGYGKGHYFVAEADESDGSFLNYPAFGAILTNIEQDHMAYWKAEAALIEGFKKFAAQVSSSDHLFWCADDFRLKALDLPGFSYGFAHDADLKIEQWRQNGWSLVFTVTFQGKTYADIVLPLIGEHNVLNGAAVFGMGLVLGLEEAKIRHAFESFLGVKRRMEKKGEKRGVAVYDDYGHHPTEIRATLKAVKAAAGERRVVVAFQPHRYSRTQDCFNDFIGAFEDADALVLTEIYAAREAPIPGVTGEALFAAVQDQSQVNTHFIKRASMADFLSGFLRPHDILVTMGAGDITKLGPEVLEKPVGPFTVAILSGGKSAEHEVAHSSADMLMKGLNPEFYTYKHLKISKTGDWFLGDARLDFSEVAKQLKSCDLCIPVLHGPYCEDGMIQGFLETLGVPYAGCDYRSCALSMDKGWTKHLAVSHAIRVSPFLDFFSYEWEADPEACLKKITEQLPFPLFVKPVHLGSTIGVSRAVDPASLRKAIEEACALDFRFLVEEEIVGQEIQFGFLGNFEVFVSDPGEVTRRAEIHTYDEKYGPNATPTIPKVALPPSVYTEGKKIAERIYRIAGCTGLARIDFFLKPDGTWILNEINPMPGLTPTSAYPKMMSYEGFSMAAIVDKIVIGGLHRHRYQNRHLRIPKVVG
jgi:UDP-N-acetylmuramate--alanine ligase